MFCDLVELPEVPRRFVSLLDHPVELAGVGGNVQGFPVQDPVTQGGKRLGGQTQVVEGVLLGSLPVQEETPGEKQVGPALDLQTALGDDGGEVLPQQVDRPADHGAALQLPGVGQQVDRVVERHVHLHALALPVRAENVRKCGLRVSGGQVKSPVLEQALQALAPEPRLEGHLEGHIHRVLGPLVLPRLEQGSELQALRLDEDGHVEHLVRRAKQSNLCSGLARPPVQPDEHAPVELHQELCFPKVLALQPKRPPFLLVLPPGLLQGLLGRPDPPLQEGVRGQQHESGISVAVARPRQDLLSEADGVVPAALCLPPRHLQELEGRHEVLHQVLHRPGPRPQHLPVAQDVRVERELAVEFEPEVLKGGAPAVRLRALVVHHVQDLVEELAHLLELFGGLGGVGRAQKLLLHHLRAGESLDVGQLQGPGPLEAVVQQRVEVLPV
mmetsp:Transcript_5932/g.17838  ORF Transcript_5932/g.17838 Transcript_5932/m.17838 type:complete len:442 (-) Transcript_5932:745-2070(-)